MDKKHNTSTLKRSPAVSDLSKLLTDVKCYLRAQEEVTSIISLPTQELKTAKVTLIGSNLDEDSGSDTEECDTYFPDA